MSVHTHHASGTAFITALQRAGSILRFFDKSFPLDTSGFFLCRLLFILASEFLDFFVFAYSWPGRITLESQPHGYEEGGHVCFTLLFFLFFNVVTMGCFFLGVGLRRRSGSDAYLFRLLNMGGSSRWVRHCVSARTIWQRLGNMCEHLRCCVMFLCPTNWSWTQGASKRRSVLQAIPSVAGGVCPRW